MQKIIEGQRYMSEAEPELGLGILKTIEDKTLIVEFRSAEETRRYGKKTAPLKRVIFDIGDEISSNESLEFIVQKVTTDENGLMRYFGDQSQEISEIDLLDSVSFHHPEEKLLNGYGDPQSLFLLRQRSLKLKEWLSSLECRGLIGGRLSLILHQFYLATKITKRNHPRVLLADEVGLGKTIEAGLIINKLIINHRAERVLILVPNTLCYQWFIEMYRKYNLSFSVVNEQTNLEKDSNPFDENNLVITSMQLFYGSETARELIQDAHWDILTIDEAHKIKWEPEKENIQYEKIKKLSSKIKSLLLLTATPEMFGAAGHFARLHLIDPDQFFSFDQYLKDNIHLRTIAHIGKKVIENKPIDNDDKAFLKEQNISFENNEKLLKTLLDTHGTGRIYFRNSRKKMSKVFDFFPERIPHFYPLEDVNPLKYFNKNDQEDELKGTSYTERIKWLINFLKKDSTLKVLLICRSKKKILKIEKDLLEMSTKNKIALFHSDLSLMARDRQAAYFADPLGANILLCTEIGSEGRNFEFAHHLVLFDLPSNPELLEQRIGRLDRIGQNEDIHIHIPYLKKSWEEILVLWYNDALDAFHQTTAGGMKTLYKFNDELQNAFLNVSNFFDDKNPQFNNLIIESKNHYQDGFLELENGRDKLIELNSFHETKAIKIVDEIKKIDQSSELRNYLELVYGHFGINIEDLDEDSQFIKPSDNMFIPHFPGLSHEGLSYTFCRKKALLREDLDFMTWDHPLVIGVMDLFLGQEFGNLTVTTRKKQGTRPKVFFELFFVIETIAPKHLQIQNFLPPKTIRILINPDLENYSMKWKKEDLDDKLVDADRALQIKVSKYPKPKIKTIIKKANDLALIEANKIVNNAHIRITDFFNQEINRLEELRKINKTIKEEEIDELRIREKLILDYIKGHTIQLDSLRFIY